jgi:hypothetical protein
MDHLKKALIAYFCIIIMSCAPFGVPQSDVTIEEIEGSWEGLFPLFIGYCRLEINAEGKGYFVVVFKEDDVEVSKIVSISTLGKEIEIKLDDTDSDSEDCLSMKGVVWFDRMYLETTGKTQQEKMTIFLLRDSSLDKFRGFAIEKINELNKK